ncbi:MAG: DUF2336 domain-containing protein [Alphaproteobacteria bacterium]|nr:DUF2336 domain-containing protein [Alphaproteobacteria bacterium]
MPQEESVNVEELYALAKDKSVSGRSKLVGSVSDLLFDSDREISETERTLMTDILISVVRDVEQAVRSRLAERIAERPDAPHQVVALLANDQIEIARPILERSRLLDDAELIGIIQVRTMQHRLAISARDSISEDVTDALVSKGETTVIERLLQNPGAQLSLRTMEFLVDESRRVEVYRKPLLERRDLSPELAGRMYRWVSAALRTYILQNFDVDQETLDENINAAIDDLMEEVRSRARSGDRPIELKELLEHAQATSPEFLIELLREGQIALFEGLFAELAQLPISTARRLIYEPRGESFAIACKAADLPKSQFGSLFVLSRKARPDDKKVDPEEVPRAMSVFERVTTPAARAILARWRVDPDFLALLRHFPLEQFESIESALDDQPPAKREAG